MYLRAQIWAHPIRISLFIHRGATFLDSLFHSDSENYIAKLYGFVIRDFIFLVLVSET